MLLRDAAPGDEPAVARVHVRSWQVAYRGIVPTRYLEAMRPEDRASRYMFGRSAESDPQAILALEEERVVGFATVGPSRKEDPLDGASCTPCTSTPTSGVEVSERRFWTRRTDVLRMEDSAVPVCGFSRTTCAPVASTSGRVGCPRTRWQPGSSPACPWKRSSMCVHWTGAVSTCPDSRRGPGIRDGIVRRQARGRHRRRLW